VYKNRTAEAWKNRGSGGIPGVEGLKDNNASNVTGSAATNKNAKRREARRKAKADEESNNEPSTTGAATPATPAQGVDKENWRATAPEPEQVEPVDPEAEKERKARNLKKKLRQARDLRDKKEKGEDLLPEQFEKVIKIQELIRQLDSLGFDADGEKERTAVAEDAGV
jgi:partner of Y14 and mago protein